MADEPVEDVDVDVVDLDKLTFEEMMALPDSEIDKLMSEFDAYKEERAKFQADSFLKLPNKPPLVLDCIHFLRLNGGLRTEGIFRVNGDANSVDAIKNSFIKNVDMNDILLSVQQEIRLKNYDVATALKSYFRLLELPLVPHKSYQAIKSGVEDQTDRNYQVGVIKQELKKMPEPNKSILCYAMIFFQDIVDMQTINKMTATNLATCLTMSITRFLNSDAGPMAAMMEVGTSTKIISLMLTEVDFTEFITPKKYFELMKGTSYKKEFLPKKFNEFKKHEQYERFKPRYEKKGKKPLPPIPQLNI